MLKGTGEGGAARYACQLKMTESAQWRFRWLLETERQVQSLTRALSCLNRRVRAERRAHAEPCGPIAVPLYDVDSALASPTGSIRFEAVTGDAPVVEALCAERYLVRGMLRDLRSARQAVADGQTLDRDIQSIRDAMGLDVGLALRVALCVRRGKASTGEPLPSEVTGALDALATFVTADGGACAARSECPRECPDVEDVQQGERCEEVETTGEDCSISCVLCRVSDGYGFHARLARARRRLGWDEILPATVYVGSLHCGQDTVPGYLLVGAVALSPPRRTALLRLLRGAKAVPLGGLQLRWSGAGQRI